MIEIWVDDTQPPVGRVVTIGGDPPQPFAGWLQLLRILSDAMATENSRVAAGRLPSQLDP